MDAAELRKRLEEVIRIAEQRLSNDRSTTDDEMYRLIRTNFEMYLNQLMTGSLLEQAGKGYGLGAGRALSDWGLEDNEMWSAVALAESFYRHGK
jgi:hypothetical protein